MHYPDLPRRRVLEVGWLLYQQMDVAAQAERRNNAILAMRGAIRSGVAAMTGATTRLGQMAWMPKPDECTGVKVPVVGSLGVQQPWWEQ